MKILILLKQSVIDINKPFDLVCFYESFVKELCNSNNDVKIVNLGFVKKYDEACITNLSKSEKEKFLEDIKSYNPELIFSFNNQITKEIIELTSCPICVLDADGFEFFPNKDFIKIYSDRYFLFSFTKGWEEDKYYKFGIDKQKIAYLHLATSIKNEKLEKVRNISFIGTHFSHVSKKTEFALLKNKDLYSDLLTYYSKPYESYNEFIQKYSDIPELELYPVLDTRCFVLESLFDLGLQIYGVRWNELPQALFNLKLCYDKTPQYTLKHNQDIYNSSKINISISHPQCRGYAFPWRVYDIMASNGLLISSYSKMLEDNTKGIVQIPMFKSPYEARDLCKYALNNPNWCEDIIAASNQYINQYGQWIDNFKIIQDKIGVKLVNNTSNCSQFKIYKFNLAQNSNVTNLTNIKCQIALYTILYFVSKIPIIGHFFANSIKKNLYLSLYKYKYMKEYSYD